MLGLVTGGRLRSMAAKQELTVPAHVLGAREPPSGRRQDARDWYHLGLGITLKCAGDLGATGMSVLSTCTCLSIITTLQG